MRRITDFVFNNLRAYVRSWQRDPLPTFVGTVIAFTFLLTLYIILFVGVKSPYNCLDSKRETYTQFNAATKMTETKVRDVCMVKVHKDYKHEVIIKK